MQPDCINKLTPIKRLLYWIHERESIRRKREARGPKPWTADPILRQYRFCNVRREHDTVTQWIAKHWREPHKEDPDLWFAMIVARLFNLVTTLHVMGYPVPWEPKVVHRLLIKQKNRGFPLFNGAYIVSTNGVKMDKVEYLIERILNPIWLNRQYILLFEPNTLEAFHASLTQCNGLGSFLAAQVVADMKYVEPLRSAKDWWTFAASGPGSRRGLNRVLGRHPQESWREQDWRNSIKELRETINAKLVYTLHITLHAQDLQNCLCEYDKYCRVLFGEGRPKQRYQGI